MKTMEDSTIKILEEDNSSISVASSIGEIISSTINSAFPKYSKELQKESQSDLYGTSQDNKFVNKFKDVNIDDISAIGTDLGIKLIRNVYIDKLNKQFTWLSKNHEIDDFENSIAQVSLIGKYLKDYKKYHYNDTFYKFVVALNIAIFYDENWKNFSKEKFTILSSLILRIKNENKLDNSKILNYINDLNRKGFNSLPF